MPRESDDRDRRKRRTADDPRQRHRRHKPADSGSSLLPREQQRRSANSASYDATDTGESSGAKARPGEQLSLGSLAQLDRLNEKKGWGGQEYDQAYLDEVREKERRLEKQRRKEERAVKRAEREVRRADRDREEAAAAAAVEEASRLRALEERKELERRKRRQDEQRTRVEEYEEYEYGSQSEDRVRVYEHEKQRHRYSDSEIDDRRQRRKAERSRERQGKRQKKARLVSGPLLEEGDKEAYEFRQKLRGGKGPPSKSTDTRPWWKRRKKWLIGGILFLIILIVAIAVGVVVSKNHSNGTVESQATADTPAPSNYNLGGHNEDEYPKGTYFDPFTWYDTIDFNLTYTGELVGGLPVMGLNSTYSDDVQCNPNVPALKDSWQYGTMPIRGINVGGWLSIEPFITPSFFQKYSSHDNVVDEWTLTSALGSSRAAQTLEEHYSAFVNRQTFIDIRAAGFDHVRIPFSYWAVTTYEGDPYVKQISWRYLLRAIEYCRQQGLRVNLDVHGLPGSQNGWNHSGRLGPIGWLNGTDGDLNAQRSLDMHNQLSTFFAQPRYKNLVTMYGLANEPRMTELDTAAVLNWTTAAVKTIRANGVDAVIVFGDGFRGLDNWQGELAGEANLLLDVHQYVIFNVDQLRLSHSDKLAFACKGWTAQMQRSMDTSTGFGPTMCGEWSQADTDCAVYLNNVGVGSRWQGTLNTGNASTSILSPICPTDNNPQCECGDANADPSKYSDTYKQWLLDFAEAQMQSFEVGWGWFYWTWDTEQSVQWSYKKGMAAGILPQKVYERSFNCNSTVPDFASMGLPEYY